MKPGINQIIEKKRQCEKLADIVAEYSARENDFVSINDDGSVAVPECMRDDYDGWRAVMDLHVAALREAKADFDAMVYRFTGGSIFKPSTMRDLRRTNDETCRAILEAFKSKY